MQPANRVVEEKKVIQKSPQKTAQTAAATNVTITGKATTTPVTTNTTTAGKTAQAPVNNMVVNGKVVQVITNTSNPASSAGTSNQAS